MNNSVKTRLTALALALVMTVAWAAPAWAAEDTERQGTAWEDMEYVHYEDEAFLADTDALAAMAQSEDADEIMALYDKIYGEMVKAFTYNNIADLHYNMDVTDEYWSEEHLYNNSLCTEMDDAYATASNKVLAGPCGDAFREHVGEDAYEYFVDYVPATEREMELIDRQSALVDQYYEQLNKQDELTYKYKGQEWTSQMLNGTMGDSLYNRDYDGYWQVYDGLQKALNDLVGPIYIELVQIRKELAQIWEYDSYVDAAYKDVFCRDYTAEDAQMLCDAVKELSADYYSGLYYSDMWNASGEVSPVLDAEEQLAVLGQYAEKIDPVLAEAWQFMDKYDLCYLTDDPDSTDTGYTTTLLRYDCPFIYNRTYGNCYDIDDLSHEFGHFTDAYLNRPADPVNAQESYDLLEIHSTGLEALFTYYYDEIYDQGGDVAEFIVLDSILESILTGCIQDEFQRRVYAEDDITLDEVNAIYTDVCREYGMNVGEVDYGWQIVPHNFEDPLYYISYAVSALAALQIWDTAQVDFQKGVDMYMDVLRRGAYGDGYLTVLEQCGMKLFTEQGAVAEIWQPVVDYMQQLEDEWVGGVPVAA